MSDPKVNRPYAPSSQAQLREWFLVRFLQPAFLLAIGLGALSYVLGDDMPTGIIDVSIALVGAGLGLYLFLFVAMAWLERRNS